MANVYEPVNLRFWKSATERGCRRQRVNQIAERPETNDQNLRQAYVRS